MTNRNQPTGSGRGDSTIDPRAGAPKALTTPEKNPGAVHVVKLDGVSVPIPGISRTEAQRLLGSDSMGEVHGGGETNTALPKPSQRAQGNVAVNPGCKGC
jgi:hypothetical protein